MDVMTVLGAVPADQLGRTLCHEHLFIDLYRQYQPHREFFLHDIDLAVEEALAFRHKGGGTIVELTTPDIGRNPAGLRCIAERTGLHIIMGTGRYREPFYEPELKRTSTASLAALFTAEIEHGVDEVRPGIIGEIGTDMPHISPAEERVHRAAARAANATGLAISTHALGSPVGLDQLDLLAEEGADLRRVAIGHADTWPYPDYHRAIADRGAFVQFDTIRGTYPVETRRQVRLVTSLIEAGHLDKILLSHDLCADRQYAAYGGNGYTFISTTFRDELRRAGVSDEDIDQILTDNPRRLLCGELPRRCREEVRN